MATMETDEELLRELRLLVDRAGGGLGVKPDAVYRYVLENVEAVRHETAMHDAYQKRARANGWTVCAMCYQPFEWPHGMGFVADGGKARATCRRCAPASTGDGWHVGVIRIDRDNAMTAIEALDGTRFPAARGHYWVRFGDDARWSTAKWDGERWTYLGNDQEYTPKQSSITEWRGPLKEPG